MGAHTATSDIRREYTGSQGRVVSEMDTYHFPIQTDDYLDSSSTAKGLLWAGRTNREDRSFRRTLCKTSIILTALHDDRSSEHDPRNRIRSIVPPYTTKVNNCVEYFQ